MCVYIYNVGICVCVYIYIFNIPSPNTKSPLHKHRAGPNSEFSIQNFLNTSLKRANTYRNLNSAAGVANTTLQGDPNNKTRQTGPYISGKGSFTSGQKVLYLHTYIHT